MRYQAGGAAQEIRPPRRPEVHAETSPEVRGVRSASQIIEMMLAMAPAGKPCLSETTTPRLRELTQSLIKASPEVTEEYARFLRIRERRLHLPEADLN